MSVAFAEPQSFRQDPSRYALLPFRFVRAAKVPDRVLITSEAGEFIFLPEAKFRDFVAGRLSPDDPVASDLEAKHFLYWGQPDTAVRLVSAKLRTRKAFLRGGPSLHLFVVTLRCDHGR